MQMVYKRDLDLGGFGGLRERHYVMDRREFGDFRSDGAVDGVGRLLYLADAFFRPGGHTGMHAHQGVDIVTVLVRGELTHQGSIGDGYHLSAGDVQIQRAGRNGFQHDEINPSTDFNHLVQLWLAPEDSATQAHYQVITPSPGQATTVYGDAHSPLDGHTCVAVAPLKRGQQLHWQGDTQIYLASGQLWLNDGDATETIERETLVRLDDPHLTATRDCLAILVSAPSRPR
ncbi:MAG: pirin family protein [Alcanivoracaceae bacterium]